MKQWSDILVDNDSSFFFHRVLNENLWTVRYTAEVIDEYKKFLYLASIQEVAPSYEIDQVWHTHMLFTKDYANVCQKNFDKFIHHTPDEKKGPPTERNIYQETLIFYSDVFGYTPPSHIWTRWKKTNYAYIDLNTHWVIPAGDWKALIKLFFKYIISQFK